MNPWPLPYQGSALPLRHKGSFVFEPVAAYSLRECYLSSKDTLYRSAGRLKNQNFRSIFYAVCAHFIRTFRLYSTTTKASSAECHKGSFTFEPASPKQALKNGQRWIRTTVDSRQQIYSLSPLATRPSTHIFLAVLFYKTTAPLFNVLFDNQPVIGLEPTTYGLQNRCSTIELHRHLSCLLYNIKDILYCQEKFIFCHFLFIRILYILYLTNLLLC